MRLKLLFDLLVIDEASQVRPEDALGAIARARQIVVVGDQKQLPPTSFFDRLLSDGDQDDEDDDPTTEASLLRGAAKLGDLESILTLCEARGLNSRMLRWHYRSRDPSLIRVSNQEFYRGGLILPPSPLQEDPAYGICFTRVVGVYDRGGKRDQCQGGTTHGREGGDQLLEIRSNFTVFRIRIPFLLK
jgi:superfamily I DNA and/or RNA helicase